MSANSGLGKGGLAMAVLGGVLVLMGILMTFWGAKQSSIFSSNLLNMAQVSKFYYLYLIPIIAIIIMALGGASYGSESRGAGIGAGILGFGLMAMCAIFVVHKANATTGSTDIAGYFNQGLKNCRIGWYLCALGGLLGMAGGAALSSANKKPKKEPAKSGDDDDAVPIQFTPKRFIPPIPDEYDEPSAPPKRMELSEAPPQDEQVELPPPPPEESLPPPDEDFPPPDDEEPPVDAPQAEPASSGDVSQAEKDALVDGLFMEEAAAPAAAPEPPAPDGPESAEGIPAPVPEPAGPPSDGPLKEDENTLILGESSKPAFAELNKLTSDGKKGLCISTTFPSKLSREFGLQNVEKIWVSHSSQQGAVDPKRLDFEITRSLNNFMREGGGGIILIDGLEYLIVENGFEQVLRFIKKMCDQASVSGSTILVPLNPKSLSADQLTMLKQGFDSVRDG